MAPKNDILLALSFLFDLKSKQVASENTLRAYCVDLSQFFAEFGQIKYVNNQSQAEKPFLLIIETHSFSLKHSEIVLHPMPTQQFTNLLTKAYETWCDLSPASRNRKAACMKSFAKWLSQNDLIAADIRHHIHAPKVPQKIPHFISMDEVQSLLACLKQAQEESGGEESAAADEALILLLYGCGLRVSEACGLKWADLNLGDRSLRVNKAKGGRQRLVAIPSKVAEKLKVLERRGDYIFGDSPLHPRRAYNVVRSWGAKAGLNRPLNPHALRHSFATHLLSDGADLRILGELLGHKSLVATQKYTHLSMQKLSQIMNTHHPLAKDENPS